MAVLRGALYPALLLGILWTPVQVQHAAQEKANAAGAKELARLQQAAAKGDAEAQYRLGQLALQDRTSRPDSGKRGEIWLLRAARQGHAAAQLALGQYYQHGIHRQVNYRKAVRWLTAAAASGQTEAWLALGSIYTAGGYGVFQDRDRALACYAKAEAKATAETYHQLALVYRNGHGAIGADWPRALGYYLKAADKGHVESYHWVATCFELGIGAPADPAKAFQWYSKAAAKEHVPSMDRLVVCYEKGIGVARDPAKAKAWAVKVDAKAITPDGRFFRYYRGALNTPAREPPPSAPAKGADAPKVAEGVEVVLRSAKKEYETDELILIEVVYHNKGQQTFSWSRRAAEGAGHHFTATDAQGQVLPYPFAGHRPRRWYGGGLSTVVVLRPGEKHMDSAYLNRSVPCDKPGTYTITTTANVAEGTSGGFGGGSYLPCKVIPLQITLRAADPKKRAATIARLIQAYRNGSPPPEDFKGYTRFGGRNDYLWRLMLYRDPSVIPLFLDVLEKAQGSSDDGSYFALVGLDGMRERGLVVRALEERLEHPEKYNSPALLHEYFHHTGPAENGFGSGDWPNWKREQELTRKYHAKALQLLRQDKQYRYAHLARHLVGGSKDAFLVDYLLRARDDFQFVNGTYTLQRVKVAPEHLRRLEAMLPRQKGWTYLADAVIVQLVSMDRRRYLPELAKDPDRFSPEIRKLLEEDSEAEEARLASRLPLVPGKDLRGEQLPPGAVAQLGTLHLRVQAPVAELVFAPDGKTFATAGHDGTLRLWDTATGKELRQITGNLRGAFALQFSPDGKTLIAGGERGVIQLVDVASRPRQPGGIIDLAILPLQSENGKQLSASSSSIHDLAVSGDGKLLASSSADTAVHLWELATGKLRRQLQPPSKPERGHRVAPVAFHPDGRRLAVGSPGKGVALFDTATGKEVGTLGQDKLADVRALLFSADGKFLFTGGGDGMLRCWDAATGRAVRAFAPGRRAPVLAAALSRDGRWLASVHEGETTVVLWEVGAGKETRRFRLPRGEPYTVAFSPDGKRLAAAGDGPIIGLWDVATGEECYPAVGGQASINAVAFGRDNRTLVSGGEDGTLRLWDAVAGKSLRVLARAPEAVTHIGFADGGKSLVTLGTVLRRWDVHTGKQVGRGPERRLVAGCLSGDGARVATVDANHEVRVRDTRSGQTRLVLHSANPNLALSHDGKLLAIADAEPDGKIRLPKEGAPGNLHWVDVESGKVLGTGRAAYPNGIAASVKALLVSPNGRSVITALREDSIQLWEVATGSMRTLGKGDRGFGFYQQLALAVSPNGKTLAVVGHSIWNDTGPGKYGVRSGGGSIVLWDLVAGRRLHELHGHGGRVTALAFSPDGTLLASLGRDTTAMIWDLSDIVPNTPGKDAKLAPKEAAEAWSDLGSPEAARAYAAMGKLALAPGQTVALLRQHLKPIAACDERRLAQLVADLDSTRFVVREKAQRELRELGELAVPALRRRRSEKPSFELVRRVDALLQAHEQGLRSAAFLQRLRALEVLEWIGTSEARGLLALLAEGAPLARMTVDARAALERLGGK